MGLGPGRRLRPQHDGVNALVGDGAGRAYLTIHTEGPLTLGTRTVPYQRGGVLACLDARGRWRWVQALRGFPGQLSGPTGPGATTPTGLALAGPHLYLAGRFTGAGAGLGPHLLLNASGHYTIGHVPPLTTFQHPDAFVARLDTAGAWHWARRTGGIGSESLHFPLVRGSRLYLTGTYSQAYGLFGAATLPLAGYGDAVVAALDTAGTWQWVQRVSSLGNESFTGLAADAAGRLLLAGAFYSSGPLSLPPLSLPPQAPDATYPGGFWARLAGPALPVRGAAAAAFALYPNPARDQVTVQGPPPGTAVHVTDALGRRVAQATMPARGPLRLRLPAYLPGGVYLVRAAGRSHKLLVE